MPNGSQDILLQSQEIEQDGRSHFVESEPHFHLNMMSRRQSCNTMRKKQSAISQESFSRNFAGCQNIAKEFCLISKFVAMATKIK